MAHAVDGLDQITEENAAAVADTGRAIAALQDVMEGLGEIVGFFHADAAQPAAYGRVA
jgi:methyl-accepting chemotaxis protein